MNLAETLRLIPRQFRTGGVLVIISSVVKAVLDLTGLAVLVPVLLLIVSPGGIDGSEQLAGLFSRLGFSSASSFTRIICGGVILIILLKGTANIMITRFQNRFMMSLYRYYAQKMLDSYYHRGLLFIKSKNSAKMAYEVNNISLLYVQNIPMNIAAMISDIFLILLMFAGILVYNYIAALMVFAVFIPTMFVYTRFIGKRLSNYGKMENEQRRTQNRLVQEAFKGYPEIEVNHAFPEMEVKFETGLKKIARYREKLLTVQQMPSLIIETGIAVALVALVLLKADAALLAIFGVVALRMLPAIRNTVSRWIVLRNSHFTQDFIADTVARSDGKPVNEKERMVFNESITIENLAFSFEGTTSPIVENFSLSIRKGERIGIRGVSGSGKTTLFNLLLGLYPPTSGRISVDGVALDRSTVRSWQNIVGYVPQEVFIMDSSIADNIALGEKMDRERVAAALHAAKLGELVANLPDGIDSRIGEGGSMLSGGQKQRIGIARAIYKNAEVLFFDEATSSLDSRTEREINESILELSRDNKDITIIIIAHRETSLALCDRIIELG